MSSCCSMATDAREPCLIVLHSHSQAAGFQGSDANGRRCSEQCNTNARRGWTGSEGSSLTVGFQHAAFGFFVFFFFFICHRSTEEREEPPAGRSEPVASFHLKASVYISVAC